MLYRYCKPYSKEILFLTLCALLHTIIALSVPYVYKEVFDTLIPNYSERLLFHLYMIIVLICILSIIVNTVSYALVVRVRAHFSRDLRIAIMDDFLDYPFTFFQENPSSLLVGLVGTNIEEAAEFVWYGLRFILAGIQLVIMLVFILLFVGIKLFFLFVFSIILYFAWTILFRKRSVFYDKQSFVLRDKIYKHFFNVFPKIKEIKCYGLYNKMLEELKDLNVQEYKVSTKKTFYESFIAIGGTLTVRLSLVAIFVLGYYGIIIGDYTPGFVMTNIVYAVTIIYPVMILFDCFSMCYFKWPVLEKIRPYLGQKREQQEGCRINTMYNGLHITELNFSYSLPKDQAADPVMEKEKRIILQDLNIMIPASSICTIVGSSGAGKTTLVSLLVKLYQPPRGSIYIDDIDICDIQTNSLRRFIGLVTQEPYIFNDTLKRNIDPDERLSDNEIHDLCSQVSLTTLVEQLPEKLDTVIQEGGRNLSGGEKQRIILARRIARGNRIMILDEVTSALDKGTEAEIINTIRYLRDHHGITFINISHRLELAQYSDVIFVMEKGHVMEKGNHNSLISRKARYYELFCKAREHESSHQIETVMDENL